MAKKQLTREELYELVWSKPMRDAAATIPMSDVGLKKTCRRHNVPVPPRGYWNKFRAGHRMPPEPPLPSLEKKSVPPQELRRPSPAVSAKVQPKKAPSPASETRRRSRRKKRGGRWPVEVFYVMPIDRWEWDYSYGVGRSLFTKGDELRDYGHLNLYGTLIRPRKTGRATFKGDVHPRPQDSLRAMAASRQENCRFPSQWEQRPSWNHFANTDRSTDNRCWDVAR
jgi:hypothetical protein